MDALVQRSDEELARRAVEGCGAAFEELANRHERGVYGFFLRRTGHIQDAEDLSQRAFVAAWKALGRYDPKRPFRHWLYAIAHRLSIDHYRARRREEDLVEAVPEREGMEAWASGEVWDAARRRLDGAQWTALWLMYAEGLSVREIAGVLGRSTVGVKVLLHRARRKLARAWAAEYGWRLPQAEREAVS